MKLIAAIVLLSSLAAETNAVFTPFRLSFDSLVAKNTLEQDSPFMDALTTTGMVTVTDLPSNFKDAMKSMALTQHECLMESSNKQEQTYPDGTFRATLATHTVAGSGGKQALKHKVDNFDACIRFEEAANFVRDMTQIVVKTFALKVTSLLDINDNGPLLVTKEFYDESPFPFATFADVVENGEHLEHFHSYQKMVDTSEGTKTIDLHTDQGLFLVFTPGRLSTGKLTNGFYIQTMDGNAEEVTFSDSDDLVIMLGDGVNQFVNNKIDDSNSKLRAVPHAVQLEASKYARIWYGLMVLPPSSALHPAYDVTFGEIRQGLLAGDANSIQLACTSSDSIASHRMLDGEDTSCTDGVAIYCWHRCMNLTDFGVSEEICASQSRELRCVNPRNQTWLGESHGDYFPACAGLDWPNETEFTKLPDYPRDDAVCNDFFSFYDDNMYMNNLTLANGAGAMFQYNVSSDGLVKARLAFNGIFGWLAVGFQGEGGGLRMYNASIILAMRGGDYTPFYGLNLTLEPEVNEFVTDLYQTAFRHWSVPYEDSGADSEHDGHNDTTATERSGNRRSLHNGETHYSVVTEKDDCYTALYFEGMSISGREFNVNGNDTLIWGANNIDTYMGYHGANRGNFTVDWAKALNGESSTTGTGTGNSDTSAAVHSTFASMTSGAVFMSSIVYMFA